MVDVWAVADGEPVLLEFADDEVDVCADEFPAPESPAAVLAPVDVEVEAWALDDEGTDEVEVDGFVAAAPDVVADVVPVLAWAFDPLEPAWVPVVVVVPVWALELLPAAWVPVEVVAPAWRSSHRNRPGFRSKLLCSSGRSIRR